MSMQDKDVVGKGVVLAMPCVYSIHRVPGARGVADGAPVPRIHRDTLIPLQSVPATRFRRGSERAHKLVVSRELFRAKCFLKSTSKERAPIEAKGEKSRGTQ